MSLQISIDYDLFTSYKASLCILRSGYIQIYSADYKWTLQRGIVLGSGEYGIIYRYYMMQNNNVKLEYAVKVLEEHLEELQAVSYLQTRTDRHGLIYARVCNQTMYPTRGYVLMPLLDGTLHSIIGTLTYPEIVRIIDELRQRLCAINRMHDGQRTFSYLDIKTTNLLYKMSSNGILDIYIGDLGSIIPQTNRCGESRFLSSYRCPTKDPYWITLPEVPVAQNFLILRLVAELVGLIDCGEQKWDSDINRSLEVLFLDKYNEWFPSTTL